MDVKRRMRELEMALLGRERERARRQREHAKAERARITAKPGSPRPPFLGRPGAVGRLYEIGVAGRRHDPTRRPKWFDKKPGSEIDF